MNEIEEVVNQAINYLTNLDFEYYEDHYGYSKWETIKKTILEKRYVKNFDGSIATYSIFGLRVENKSQSKSINVNELKKILERKDEQLRLF